MNKKRILIGAGVIAVVIVLGVGYLFFFRGSTPVNAPNNNGSPFGTPGNPILPQTQNVKQQTIVGGVADTIVQKQSGLREISTVPVSDGDFIVATSTATTSAPRVRFIERSTGHVFEADLGSNAVNRITNTTVPKIENVAWGVPGVSFLAQYIDQDSVADKIITIGSVAATSATTTLTDENIGLLPVTQSDAPTNIISGAFSPNAKVLFYLTEGFSGVEGYLSAGSGIPSLVWQFPTTEWLAQWPTNSPNTVFLTTKASNGIPGLTFALDTKTKKTNVVLSGIPGLTTMVSPSGNKIVYAQIDGPTWTTSVFDQKYKTRVTLPFAALPEKCVWTKDELTLYCARPKAVSADAPDDWYQGLVSFDDSLWKFDYGTAEATEISDLSPDSGQTIDLVNPHLSPNEDYLAFTNKKDLSFWVVPLQ